MDAKKISQLEPVPAQDFVHADDEFVVVDKSKANQAPDAGPQGRTSRVSLSKLSASLAAMPEAASPGLSGQFLYNVDGANMDGAEVYYNNGNVGIGNNNPGSNKLKVSGNVDATGFSIGGQPVVQPVFSYDSVTKILTITT